MINKRSTIHNYQIQILEIISNKKYLVDLATENQQIEI